MNDRNPDRKLSPEFQWRNFPWLDSEFARARWMYVIGLCYLTIGYLGTNEIAALNPWGRPALPIATGFDKAIPFTPWMVGFYILYYPILATPVVFAANSIAITRLALAQVTTQSIAFVFFLAFPTPIERPPAVPVEGISHFFLDVLFRADHPYNTFPSMHVAQSCIVAIFFMKYAAGWPFGASATPTDDVAATPVRHAKWHQAILANRFAASVLIFHGVSAILVSASAVMIKQHYLADAASGVLLAGLTSFIFFRKPH